MICFISSKYKSSATANFLVIFGEYSAATGSSPRKRFGRSSPTAKPMTVPPSWRGEVDAVKLKPLVNDPADRLFGHHVIMNFAAPGAELTRGWVDKVFLPLAWSGRR